MLLRECPRGFYVEISGSAGCIQCPYSLNSTAESNLCFYLSNVTIDTKMLVMKCPKKKRIAPILTQLLLRCSWRKASGVNLKTLQHCLIVITMHTWACHQLATRHRLQHVVPADMYRAANHTGPLCKVRINRQQFLLQSFERAFGLPVLINFRKRNISFAAIQIIKFNSFLVRACIGNAFGDIDKIIWFRKVRIGIVLYSL